MSAGHAPRAGRALLLAAAMAAAALPAPAARAQAPCASLRETVLFCPAGSPWQGGRWQDGADMVLVRDGMSMLVDFAYTGQGSGDLDADLDAHIAWWTSGPETHETLRRSRVSAPGVAALLDIGREVQAGQAPRLAARALVETGATRLMLWLVPRSAPPPRMPPPRRSSARSAPLPPAPPNWKARGHDRSLRQ